MDQLMPSQLTGQSTFTTQHQGPRTTADSAAEGRLKVDAGANKKIVAKLVRRKKKKEGAKKQ